MLSTIFNSNDTMVDIQGISTKCMLSVVELTKSMNDFLIYIDSSGKPGNGILQGNTWMIGSYDECIANQKAHYCTMFNVALNMSSIKSHLIPLRAYGLCIPHSCNITDATNLLKILSNLIEKRFGYKFFVIDENSRNPFGEQNSYCHAKTKTFSTGATVMLAVSGVIIGLCCFGTMIDLLRSLYKFCCSWSPTLEGDYIYSKDEYLIDAESFNSRSSMSSPVSDILTPRMKEDLRVLSTHAVQFDSSSRYAIVDISMFRGSSFMRFFKCFSVIQNTKSLFNTRAPKGTITCLNGIRTISITWIIMGHYVIMIAEMAPVANVLALTEKYINRITFQPPINGGFAVDTFFLLSGTLVSYLSMKRYAQENRLPLLRYYVHRYIRLTPSYAYLIFFYTYLLPLLSDGPVWNSKEDELCQSYWWTNLLYINNFYPISIMEMCVNWGWYLANDMQFYVISPVILYCMYRFKFRGILVISTILIIIHFVSNGLLMYEENAAVPLFYEKNVMFGPHSMVLNYQNYIYEKPYCRILVYFIGLTLGYVLFNECRIAPKWRKLAHVIGWFISIPVAFALVYSPYTAMNKEWTFTVNIIYGLFFRAMWALAVAWLIFACHNGLGGLIDKILSWRVFIPLSRLTYGVYLWHNLVIQVLLKSSRSTFVVTDITFTIYYVAVTIFSFMVSYIISVCIEYPVFNLEKVLFNF